MTPFPGESIGLDRYTNVTGSAVGSLESVQLRAGSATFTAGDSTELATDLTYHYLDSSSTPTVVSWVVEVLSGSGTFTFSEGIGNTGTGLGSVTVSGPGQYVVASTFTTANVWADTDARLLMTCTSGTVVVQQVKLRVWPTAGVAGAWSDPYPSWESSNPAGVAGRRVTRAVNESTSSNTGAAAEWVDVIAAGQSHADEPWATSSEYLAAPLGTGGGSAARIRAEENIIDTSSGGTFQISDLVAVVADKDPGEGAELDPSLGLVEGVDYIHPPDEVYFDTQAIYQAAGPRSSTWTNVGVHVTGDTGPEGAATITVEAYTGDIENLPSWPDTAATPLAYGDNGVALPAGDRLLFAGSHLWMTNAPDFPGGPIADINANWGWALGYGDPNTPEFQPLGVRVTYPPYRVWNPAAVTPKFIRIMQRGDGLGMGSGRVYATGTRQASTRVYGTY